MSWESRDWYRQQNVISNTENSVFIGQPTTILDQRDLSQTQVASAPVGVSPDKRTDLVPPALSLPDKSFIHFLSLLYILFG